MGENFIASVRRECGCSAAHSIQARFGGCQVYIPMLKSLTPSHWLVVTAGLENARTICALFGGQHVYVSGNRLARIRTNVENGATAASLALRFGVTVTTARRWISRWRPGSSKTPAPENGARRPGQS